MPSSPSSPSSPAPRSRAAARGAALALALLAGAAPGRAQPPTGPGITAARMAADRASYPSRCGVNGPLDEARPFVPLPTGDVWCPLVADPKSQRSFVSYLRGDRRSVARSLASVGIADQFPMLRLAATTPGDGVQLSLAGSVFAQFDLGSSSYDLLNADYVIGLPVTVRRGRWSARLRLYHQSSHLGDEFLLRGDSTQQRPRRENLSFESAEGLLSVDVGAWRVYGGGEYLVNREPATLGRGIAHGGVELRPAGAVPFGNAGSVRLIAAVDAKAVDEQDWRVGWSARAGIEVGRPGESGDRRARRWSLLGEFYDGPSPYGQFYQSAVRLAGIGFHFTL